VLDVTGDAEIAESAGISAEVATIIADVDDEPEAVAVAEPAPELDQGDDEAEVAAVIEPDTSPNRTHPYWRPLFGGRRRRD
jgi:hypothetical protein